MYAMQLNKFKKSNGIIEKLYTEHCYFTPQQGEPFCKSEYNFLVFYTTGLTSVCADYT